MQCVYTLSSKKKMCLYFIYIYTYFLFLLGILYRLNLYQKRSIECDSDRNWRPLSCPFSSHTHHTHCFFLIWNPWKRIVEKATFFKILVGFEISIKCHCVGVHYSKLSSSATAGILDNVTISCFVIWFMGFGWLGVEIDVRDFDVFYLGWVKRR